MHIFICFQIPNETNIVGTVDLLYKLYKIFEFEPAAYVKLLIDFLDFFVYDNEEISSARLTKEMHVLGDKLRNMSI